MINAIVYYEIFARWTLIILIKVYNFNESNLLAKGILLANWSKNVYVKYPYTTFVIKSSAINVVVLFYYSLKALITQYYP